VRRVVVPGASIQDRDGAKRVLDKARGGWPRRRRLGAEGGSAGKRLDGTQAVCPGVLQIVKRTDDVPGFHLLPRRWVVERTFSWRGNYRRWSKDYE